MNTYKLVYQNGVTLETVAERTVRDIRSTIRIPAVIDITDSNDLCDVRTGKSVKMRYNPLTGYVEDTN